MTWPVVREMARIPGLGTPQPLKVVGSRGERSSVLLPAESEVVHDRIGGAVSYRRLTGEDGMRLSVPRTFVHDGRADWVELVSAPGAVEHEAARVLFDIAARSQDADNGARAHEQVAPAAPAVTPNVKNTPSK